MQIQATLVLLASLVSAKPIEDIQTSVNALVSKKISDIAGTPKQGRSLAKADWCTSGSLLYTSAKEAFGEALLTCYCGQGIFDNADATTGAMPTPSADAICACASEYDAKFPNTGLTDACEESKKGDDPCFARTTYAIGVNGESIPMASLRAGDLVLDGSGSTTRVIVNQHRVASVKSSLLVIDHANGQLSLTPDHVLAVDGHSKFGPARSVVPGSRVGHSEVSSVTTTTGEVINPLTTSGKILTQGGVLASTYPEWIADYMLSSRIFPLPMSLSNAISYVFPETTQAFYDAVVESVVTAHHPKHLKANLPAPLIPAAFVLGDLALAAGFVAFSLASPMALVAVAVTAFAAAKARK